MNDIHYTGPDGEPTLTDLEKEFGWTCWRGTDGQCFARRPTTPDNDHDARGEDPLDLRDTIRLALSAEAEANYRTKLTSTQTAARLLVPPSHRRAAQPYS